VIAMNYSNKNSKQASVMNTTSLILKSFAGLLFLLLVMGAALFIPYRSLNYDLAWLYISIFTFFVSWITIYLAIFDTRLLKSRLVAGPVAETRSVQKIIQSVAALAFIATFVLSSLDHKNKWSAVPVKFSYAADLFCALAFVLLFYVFKQNTFLSATVEVQEEQKVISTGLYGLVRHPMYSAALLLLLFTPIALGSWFGFIPVFVLGLSIAYRAVDEEKELKQHLAGYREYCEKVKYRIIPFLF
jgi:protein-S-isoprenylcysteine O-methyltransferase Ste14